MHPPASIEIERYGKRMLPVEPAYRVSVIFYGHSHHAKLPALEHLVHCLQIRHFVSARNAPGSPEVYKDQISLIVAQVHLLAIQILENEIWNSFTNGDSIEWYEGL